MNRASRLLLIGVLVLLVGYPIYARRFQIEAKIWHWRHGYSAAVGDYVVPIPDHWLILVEGVDGRDLAMFDTLVKGQPGPLLTPNMITVMSLSHPLRSLDSWESIKRQQLEHSGLSHIEEKTLWAADQKIVCLGGYELRDVLHVPGATHLSLECQSAGQLNLIFIGYRSGLEDFYTIASQIRKRK
jgi:hypothetical protein